MAKESNVSLPRIARYKPFYYKLVPGQSYFWCSCGLSKKQPFCDGSHATTDLQPVKYTATDTDGEVLFCGCKQSDTKPFCDGAHNNLTGTYAEDDPESPANREIPAVRHHRDGRLELNGRCYVASVEKTAKTAVGNTNWRSLITQATGAYYQSQFHFDIAAGRSPNISFGDRHVVLLATAGDGSIEISSKTFPLAPEMGIYVRPGETFAIENNSDTPISLFASVCPQAEAPEFPNAMDPGFDANAPVRTVAFNTDMRQLMGDRTFQLLVDKDVGSDLVTQFIGDIPQSKAAPHRHLYEEALIVLKGDGCMWTEDMKAPVHAGDIIFLPAKQVHSLQCTDPGGMVVAGVIYPGGNPNINF